MNAKRPTTGATVVANGKRELIDLPCSLAQFLQARQLDSRQVAVERNGEVVFKSAYPSTPLQDGDRLEIVKVVAGG